MSHAQRKLAISTLQLAFLTYNAVIGVLVGWGTARSPFFAALGVPSFAWLVLGMLAFELVVGLALRAHPSIILSMGWRIAGLLVSFVACYASVGMLQAV